MSLFHSAFDSGASSAGPSRTVGSALGPGAASHKRKRPSSGGKDDQLHATQVNLEKLMSRVERGEIKEKMGNEGLGQMGKKQKRKSGGAAPPPAAASPRPQFNKGDRGDKKPGQKKEFLPRKEFLAKKEAEKKEKKGDKGKKDFDPKSPREKRPRRDSDAAPITVKYTEADKPTPKSKAKSNANRPTPVELPMPIPTKRSADDADDGLTDMQRQMKAKLEGARFRWINEELYTTSSTDAVSLMRKDPKIFADYHDTHRQLTAAWPSPPLPHIVALLAPLPKSTVIVDLGCGDAGLARELVPQGKVVLSYDLVGDSGAAGAENTLGGAGNAGSGGWVVSADFLSHVPLPGRPGGIEETNDDWKITKKGGDKKKRKDMHASEIADAVVCCLSLMGTNWVGGVYEAVRVLKQGGAFHVAEVTSRFVDTADFVEIIESFGLVCESQEEPSTHFTLFKFVKKAAVPQGPVRGEEGWEERVAAGEGILRACVYKKR